jgi:hypothetical protein
MLTRIQKRKLAIKRATPAWLDKAQVATIRKIKEACKALNKEHGARTYHVDHMEPLRGKHVCGLHVPWNMQIILATKNMAKGNRK